MKTIKSVSGRFVTCVVLVAFFCSSCPPLARAAVYGPPTYCMGSSSVTPSNCEYITTSAVVSLAYPTAWNESVSLNFPFQWPCQFVYVEKSRTVNGQKAIFFSQMYSNVCASVWGQSGPLCGNPYDSYTTSVTVKNTHVLGYAPYTFTVNVSYPFVDPPPDN